MVEEALLVVALLPQASEGWEASQGAGHAQEVGHAQGVGLEQRVVVEWVAVGLVACVEGVGLEA